MADDKKDKNRPKTVARPQNKNLKTDAGPGRPKGQRNYRTLYREALKKIGESQNKTAEEIETILHTSGLAKAMKGDYSFYKDTLDRIHGQAVKPVDVQGNLTISTVLDGLENSSENVIDGSANVEEGGQPLIPEGVENAVSIQDTQQGGQANTIQEESSTTTLQRELPQP